MNTPDKFELISVYTRKQAIADGFQVDVSETGREAGIKYPLFITRAAWERCVALPPDYRGHQDERGRLWDIVWILRARLSCGASGASGAMLQYQVLVFNLAAGRTIIETLVATVGALDFDDAKPAITIMLPGED